MIVIHSNGANRGEKASYSINDKVSSAHLNLTLIRVNSTELTNQSDTVGNQPI